jgi:hypothetical protein
MCDKVFQINSYLSLKLEKGETHIYIKDTRFSGKLSLLLSIPIDDTEESENNGQIDELEDFYFFSSELEFVSFLFHKEFSITPQEEFWGHCSNIQAWVEHEYNTDLLSSTISFPLLKKLYLRGDPQALKIFKQEIVKKLLEGTFNTKVFLVENQYLDFLTDQERKVIYASNTSQINEFFARCVEKEDLLDIALEILLKFSPQQNLIKRLEKNGFV